MKATVSIAPATVKPCSGAWRSSSRSRFRKTSLCALIHGGQCDAWPLSLWRGGIPDRPSCGVMRELPLRKLPTTVLSPHDHLYWRFGQPVEMDYQGTTHLQLVSRRRAEVL